MSLEQAIQENTEAVRALVAALQSGAQIAAVAEPDPAGEPKARRGRPPKSETAAQSAKDEPAASTTPETATTAPTATPQAESASVEKQQDIPFDNVTKKIVELNKAKGRDAVMSVIENFLGEGAVAKGKKVPDLASVGKNADIVAFVDGLLAPADDDLGI